MKWEIIDNKICLSDEKTYRYLNAHDIQQAVATNMFEGYELPNICETLGMRISKIGLSVKPTFAVVNNNVTVNLYAIKAGNEYAVERYEGKFVDYLLLNNTCYFLSGAYGLLSEYIEENSIDVSNTITYVEFMNICRFCKDNGITYVENVISESQNDYNNDIDNDLHADLFEYQKNGFNWLKFMNQNECGCILADEMGLGKTLQIIALLGYVKKSMNKAHFLVIAPVSLLENWKREIYKFYPSLSVIVHHGSSRTGDYNYLLGYDVVVTSYSNLHSDLSMFNMIKWQIVVLDEAQNIKNPYAKRSKDVKKINKVMGIAVTGTPFENHMTDLWSIIDYILPGYCGTLGQYEAMFDDSYDAAEEIEKMLTPIMIRRRVKDVAKDLPERIDIPHPIVMTEEEASYYEQQRQDVSSLEKMKEFSIDKIQKLRMFCTHPLVYGANIGNKSLIEASTKYSLFCDIVEEIVESEEKIIVFTSYNKMVDIMIHDLKNRFGVYVNYINGSTPVSARQGIIDEFSQVIGPGILILNPKAAGTGLNITCANHVIHYNLEWNPAIEDQASARAYRRGQKKTVFVHRLFYTDTIDEVMNDRIQFKRDLSEMAVVGNQGSEQDKKDLLRALSLSPIGGEHNE